MHQIAEIFVLLLSVLSGLHCMVVTPVDNAIPNFNGLPESPGYHGHRHRHSQHRHNRQSHLKTNSLDGNNLDLQQEVKDQVMFSPRVVLSSHKPVIPPIDLMEEPLEDLNDLARTALEISENATSHTTSHSTPNTGGGHRSKRSIDYVHVPVCDSVSEWVERMEAYDMWGNKVVVLQEIDIGGTRVNQYFYETKCREERTACVGIDTNQYLSVCKNKHVWAYAKVRTISGDEGWNLIKIPGSCNCALFKKKTKRFSLLNLLEDLR